MDEVVLDLVMVVLVERRKKVSERGKEKKTTKMRKTKWQPPLAPFPPARRCHRGRRHWYVCLLTTGLSIDFCRTLFSMITIRAMARTKAHTQTIQQMAIRPLNEPCWSGRINGDACHKCASTGDKSSGYYLSDAFSGRQSDFLTVCLWKELELLLRPMLPAREQYCPERFQQYFSSQGQFLLPESSQRPAFLLGQHVIDVTNSQSQVHHYDRQI